MTLKQEIDKVGENTKKGKKLEEQKQKELAKIKNKYNKKQQAMEIAQAVASTAMAAINAYASVSIDGQDGLDRHHGRFYFLYGQPCDELRLPPRSALYASKSFDDGGI